MSVGSAKYRPIARELFKCVKKTLTLSPCDVSFEQRVKGKVTAKLLNVSPPLAKVFYRNFSIFAWAFTATFFVALAYTLYSIYNFIVYGSCEPGGVCYLTTIGWCILLIEKIAVYLAIAIMIGVTVYLLIRRTRHPRK
jgi:hypothetical protein